MRDSGGKSGQPERMAGRGKIKSPKGGAVQMARSNAPELAAAAEIVPNLTGAFDFSQILGGRRRASGHDWLLDREERYRFVNKALADWFERPRKEILGRTDARDAGRGELCGPPAADRRRLCRRAAMVRCRLPPSDAGHARRPGRLCPANGWPREGGRDDPAGAGRHRAAHGRAGAQGKRGAVPPDRRFRAGDDVGHPARPDPRFRQRRLCRIRRHVARGGQVARLARSDPPGRPGDGWSPKAWRAKRASSRSRWRRAICGTMANGAGCGRCRSRGSARTGRCRASSALPATSPRPRRPSSSFSGRWPSARPS